MCEFIHREHFCIKDGVHISMFNVLCFLDVHVFFKVGFLSQGWSWGDLRSSMLLTLKIHVHVHICTLHAQSRD